MDENNDIEKRIRESFDGLNKPAPDNLWNKLSGKLSVSEIDKGIDTKIKNGFENINKSAPSHIWNSVNRQLNIDKVWKRISAQLDRKSIIIYWRKLGGIAALLLLLLGGGIYMFNNNKNALFVPVTGQLNPHEQKNTEKIKQLADISDKSNLTKGTKNHLCIGKTFNLETYQFNNNNYNSLFVPITGQLNQHEQKNTQEIQQLANISDKSNLKKGTKNHTVIAKTFNLKKYPVQQNGLTASKNSNAPLRSVKNNSSRHLALQKNNVTENITEKLIKNTFSIDSMQLITMIPIKTIFIGNIIPSDSILIASSITQPVIPADTMVRRKKQFEIGIIYAYNNTWLINNDTRNSFNENSLIQAIPAFAGSYGLIANYGISNNSAVSAEFYINSKYIQKYDEFVEGFYNRRTTEFNYYKFALLYQFNINQSPHKLVSSKYTFKAGFYGSYLKTQTHDYTRVVSPKTETYTKIDYGVRIAIGQEKTIKRIIIGYGLNAEYGFKNIFEGNRKVPSQFNVSRNAFIGGYVNLKYCF